MFNWKKEEYTHEQKYSPIEYRIFHFKRKYFGAAIMSLHGGPTGWLSEDGCLEKEEEFAALQRTNKLPKELQLTLKQAEKACEEHYSCVFRPIRKK